ncbi:hypothetical protein ACTXIV_02540 [Psychrobacter celer]|uniref:hypothetical protein n=1 Tax=Psychrobacter celer TaxID=306572 RepID=UPI003FD5CD04
MQNTKNFIKLKLKEAQTAIMPKAKVDTPVLDTKKLIELKIKSIHKGYDYPNDWALTDHEFKAVMAMINSQFYFEHGDEDNLDDIIDCGLRIDSKTGEVFYEGHQIDTPKKTYYYKAESDALDKLKDLIGENFVNFRDRNTNFEYFRKRWDEFEPTEAHPVVMCCRYTNVL